MSGKVDEFGYPDYTADFDGRLISAAGGASGKLTLLNGQQITFPWKRQQEIVNSYPGYIQVYDDPLGGGGGVEYLVLSAPKLLAGSTSGSILLAGYNDGTSSIVIQTGTGQSLILSSSGIVTTNNFYAGTVTSTGLIDGTGGITISGGSVDLRSSNSVDVNIQAGTGRDAYMIAGRDVWLLPTQDLYLQPSRDASLYSDRNMVVACTTGNMQLYAAAGNITIQNALGSLAMNTLFGAWTTYTPTVTQTGTVTQTTTYSKYLKIGRLVVYSFALSCTGTGTAASAVTVTLPFTAAQTGLTCGTFTVYDSSATTFYTVNARLYDATHVSGVPYATANWIGATGFSAALASGDLIEGTITYEATS